MKPLALGHISPATVKAASQNSNIVQWPMLSIIVAQYLLGQ